MENVMIWLIEELDRLLKRSLVSLGGREEFNQLTISQLNYLSAVNRVHNPTVTGLADELHLSKPSVTSGVKKLIQLGYLQKKRSHEDLRIQFLSLTNLGNKLVSTRDAALEDFINSVKNALTDQEQQNFETLLKKLLISLNQRYSDTHHD
jgi:DNA-binding MarR family transcriptional regulator